ncbi:hypothetical protein SSX86_032923 [Deinandra increscens subsp. villosa]|uniref:Uncharacterized protein n=1 Tax=Deinandra increscens subsp. villosa TaxID=3103831 RepID=A0AAP0C6P5_9ASTR
MEGRYNNDHNYVWADESDAKTVNVYPAHIKRSKLEDGLEKTKDLASTGLRKIKRGSTVGFQWIKQKYHKTTHKQQSYPY